MEHFFYTLIKRLGIVVLAVALTGQIALATDKVVENNNPATEELQKAPSNEQTSQEQVEAGEGDEEFSEEKLDEALREFAQVFEEQEEEEASKEA